jgi:hypothetical protein
MHQVCQLAAHQQPAPSAIHENLAGDLLVARCMFSCHAGSNPGVLRGNFLHPLVENPAATPEPLAAASGGYASSGSSVAV